MESNKKVLVDAIARFNEIERKMAKLCVDTINKLSPDIRTQVVKRLTDKE